MIAGDTMPSRASRRRGIARHLAGRGELRLAAGLFVVLLAVNIVLNPARFAPATLGVSLGLAAPLILAAIASTPPILSGRGGIDISVGPLMGLINVVLVVGVYAGLGIASPWLVVPIALALGLVSGAVNGFLTTILRIQPIVATLGTFLLYAGLALTVAPSPIGTVPPWLKLLAGPLSIVPILAAAALWLAIKRTPYYEHLMATGSDDRAAYTAGVPVTAVRWIAYLLAGIFAGLAGLSLTALISSADPNIGPTYALLAISAVALGGVSLAGGRGGMVAAVLGALDIFLLQTALTYFNVSTFVLQIAYGVALTIAVALNSDRWGALFGRGRA